MSDKPKTREISKDEFERMTPAQQNNVLLTMIGLKGKGVVKDKDGNIRYDDPSKAGQYDEPELQSNRQ